MEYIVIEQDGTLHRRTAPDYTTALQDVGPEGWNRVQLTRDLAAYVNDVSLVSEKYHRNVVGGLLLMAFGAHRMPYAGPVVLVGWDQQATRRDEPEVTGLSPVQDAAITAVYNALVEDAPLGADINAYQVDQEPDRLGQLVDELQGLIDLVKSGPVPGWEIRTL